MALSDTLKNLDDNKKSVEEFEAKKPEIIQNHKELINSLLSELTSFVQEYIDSEKMSVTRNKKIYNDYGLSSDIETESMTIKAGMKNITIEPVGRNMMGELIFEMYSSNQSSKKYSIYMNVKDKKSEINENANNRTRGENRSPLNKDVFENTLDKILTS